MDGYAWASYAIAYEVLCEATFDGDVEGAVNASAAIADWRDTLGTSSGCTTHEQVYLDTETCGLHSMMVLLQYAEEDGR